MMGHKICVDGEIWLIIPKLSLLPWGGQVVRCCWVNLLLVRIIVGQGPTVLAVGAGEGCLGLFFFVSSVISLFLLAQYRLKYCLRGLFHPRHSTNQISVTPNLEH